MGNIYYDPERILNGFTEDRLKDIAKRLKRRIRVIKSDIIQDIVSPLKGRPSDRVKVWQEINRYLRKELERFSQEELKLLSPSDIPMQEQLKVSYMLTLSSNPEIKAVGEKLYCQAQENNVLGSEAECEGLIPPVDVEGSRLEDEQDKGDDKDEDEEQDEETLAVFGAVTAEVEAGQVKELTNKHSSETAAAREIIEPVVIENKRVDR